MKKNDGEAEVEKTVFSEKKTFIFNDITIIQIALLLPKKHRKRLKKVSKPKVANSCDALGNT